jgi:hypothetical protein
MARRKTPAPMKGLVHRAIPILRLSAGEKMSRPIKSIAHMPAHSGPRRKRLLPTAPALACWMIDGS